MQYRLLDEFRHLFEGVCYRHRDSSLGDWVAVHLYEDLYALGKSTKFCERVRERDRVLNLRNRREGIRARRGDGTFGELIPNETPVVEEGFLVARGAIATVEIGTEVKVLAKAMIKQIDRVINDLVKQVSHFRHGGGNPICVGIVGINSANIYTSYEGDREYQTGSKGFPHPVQEAANAENRLTAQAQPSFDEFVVLHFRATNAEPYPFEWVNYESVARSYGAALVRISREYERRF